MADITTTKAYDHQEGDEIVEMTRTYVSRIINGILLVNLLSTDDSGNPKEVLIMEQPWKPNLDGSRSSWIDDNDAAAWLESIKNTNL